MASFPRAGVSLSSTRASALTCLCALGLAGLLCCGSSEDAGKGSANGNDAGAPQQAGSSAGGAGNGARPVAAGGASLGSAGNNNNAQAGSAGADSNGGTANVAGATNTAGAGGQTADELSFPLRTKSRYIVDATMKRVKLASVNWYGASDVLHVVSGLNTQKLADIVRAIKSMGFNSIRLPFSNVMLHTEQVEARAIAANPEFATLSPLEVYDRVIEELTRQGLLVILNNHTTHAMWCCNFDSDGLWYTSDYSEEQWVEDWVSIVRRYKANPRVIAADLRNEVRIAQGNPLPNPPNWASLPNDWRVAAERAGNRILEEHPDLLVVVEGINFPRHHLKGVRTDPIRLILPNRLVYAAHNYGFIGPELTGTKYGEMDFPTFKAKMDEEWGYVIREGEAFTAPVWVSEFGDSNDSEWFRNIVRYLAEGDFDWAYWAINPAPKPSGDDETFGLLEKDWVTPLADARVAALESIMAPRRGPGVEPNWDADIPHHFDPLLFADWDTNHSENRQDWASGTYKATCGEGFRIVGLSQASRAAQRYSHMALCSDWGLTLKEGDRRYVRDEGTDSPDIGAHTSGKDWASGFTKLECREGEYIAGLAQTRNTLKYALAGILCVGASNSLGSNCHTVAFDSADQRRSELPHDWDSGATKGQCGATEYVAGVSTRNGVPHSLLCCGGGP